MFLGLVVIVLTLVDFSSSSSDYFCFEHFWNSSDACSGNGNCTAPGTCNCSTIAVPGGDPKELFTGEECQYPYCFTWLDHYDFISADLETETTQTTCSGFTSDEFEIEQCHGNGICHNNVSDGSLFNVCTCADDDTFGVNCAEIIGQEYSVKYYVSRDTAYDIALLDEIRVSYSVSKHLLQVYSLFFTKVEEEIINLILDFPCYLIVQNSDELLGEDSWCWWDWDTESDNVFELVLEPEEGYFENIIEGDILHIMPLTNQSQIVDVIVYEPGEDPYDPLILYIALGICGGVFGVFCLIVFFVLCCFCCKIMLQKKKLRDFEDIEGIDIMLQENKVKEREEFLPSFKINKKLFEIQFSDVKVTKKIGEGGSNSVVFKAQWKGQPIAFKAYKLHSLCQDESKFKEFERELEILASVSHPFVLRFYGASLKPPRVGILLEYCSNGDIQNFLEGKHSYPVPERLRLLREIASALAYLHSSNIIHRDLKGQNVLVTQSEETRLMDFGLSKMIIDNSTEHTRRVGTSYYMAPEVCLTNKYTNKCDVFSFSMLAIEIATCFFNPYGKKVSTYGIEWKVAKDEKFRPKISVNDYHECEWMVDIIKRCWVGDPKERPTFDEIYKLMDEKMKETYPDKGKEVNKKSDKEIIAANVKVNKQLKLEVQHLRKLLKKKNKKINKLIDEMKEQVKSSKKSSSMLTKELPRSQSFQGTRKFKKEGKKKAKKKAKKSKK